MCTYVKCKARNFGCLSLSNLDNFRFIVGPARFQGCISSKRCQLQQLPLRNKMLSESDQSEIQNGSEDTEAGLQCSS